VVLSTNKRNRFCGRHTVLALSILLLYVFNAQVLGQDEGIAPPPIINPEEMFSNTTIKYRIGGNFDYYNKDGQRVGGGRKQADGSYKVYYRGRVKTQGYLAGSVIPEKPREKVTDFGRRSPESTAIFNGGNSVSYSEDTRPSSDETKPMSNRTPNSPIVRDGNVIDKTTYNVYGQPYYRWNSEEKDTSHIQDPRVRAEVKEAQNQEWSRHQRERR
jgi:hypothetical protein